jgi:RNA polymerase sigma-70 factor, ECF subfamily
MLTQAVNPREQSLRFRPHVYDRGRADHPPLDGQQANQSMPPSSDDFTRIYRANAEEMLVYFQRRLHDAEQAVDLLAETFAVAIERMHQYRGDGEDQLSAWVWAIARSLLSAAERRGSVERRHLERLGIERRELQLQEVERIEELAGFAALREQVMGLVERLPAPQREAVRLRMVEERDYEEVAARLGISQQTARARVSRGLRALRRLLTNEDELEGKP